MCMAVVPVITAPMVEQLWPRRRGIRRVVVKEASYALPYA